MPDVKTSSAERGCSCGRCGRGLYIEEELSVVLLLTTDCAPMDWGRSDGSLRAGLGGLLAQLSESSSRLIAVFGSKGNSLLCLRLLLRAGKVGMVRERRHWTRCAL